MQLVFTGDYAILQSLNAYYRNQLLLVESLFETAQAAGLKTAAVGKTGLSIQLPTDPDGKDIDSTKSSYEVELYAKTLRQRGRPFSSP
jgi:hypothetical protein